jgi:oxygen-independent coproporphyrinogen-3 oxidase
MYGATIRPPRTGCESVRFATPDTLEGYLAGLPATPTPVSCAAAREEAFFLGLRLNRGLDLEEVRARFGEDPATDEVVQALCREGLLERHDGAIRLTARGRLLSNEAFERFLAPATA